MNVAMVGMGLIGGSIAKSLRENTDCTLFGEDCVKDVVQKAIEQGVLHYELSPESLKSCELVIVALYPESLIAWLEENACHISADTVVIDTCGVKQMVCEPCFKIAREHGFTFIGTHPMAGVEHSGYDYSKGDMFKNASLIVVPDKNTPKEKVDKLIEWLTPAGFGRTVITDAEDHDRMIAFTSQLAHVVSSAYVQLPCALRHVGFSAGSYRDMTRVATLNEDMWTELFMENSEMLYKQIDELIAALKIYSEAIRTKNAGILRGILREGRIRKEQVDGKYLR